MKKLMTATTVYGPFENITEVKGGYDIGGCILPITVIGEGEISDWQENDKAGLLIEVPQAPVIPQLADQPVTWNDLQKVVSLLNAGQGDEVVAKVSAISDGTAELSELHDMDAGK